MLCVIDGTILRDPTPYEQLVGSLIYLTIIQPDISHVVHNIVNQSMSAPRSIHYNAVFNLSKYTWHDESRISIFI